MTEQSTQAWRSDRALCHSPRHHPDEQLGERPGPPRRRRQLRLQRCEPGTSTRSMGFPGRVPGSLSAQPLSGAEGTPGGRALFLGPNLRAALSRRWPRRLDVCRRAGRASRLYGHADRGRDRQEALSRSAKFRREEQRRFELLVAHWDTPLSAVDFETRAISR